MCHLETTNQLNGSLTWKKSCTQEDDEDCSKTKLRFLKLFRIQWIAHKPWKNLSNAED